MFTNQELRFFEDRGVIFENFRPGPNGYAMDAQPGLTTTPNAGIPTMFTTAWDPETIEVVFAPNEFANIFTERLEGEWAKDTFEFTIKEFGGEVSSYDDFSENGHTTANYEWEWRQAWLYQTMIQAGQREIDRMGLARQNYVSDLNGASILVLNKMQNLTYAYGVNGLQNYGALNDPNLNASITPAVKANGGTAWFNSVTSNASANEVYNDVLALFTQLVVQSSGVIQIDKMNKLVLALGPQSMNALAFTNTYGITVEDMIKKTFKNLRIVAAMQYEALSASNPQGNPAGNFAQMICEDAAGQTTAFCAYNEKLRAHTLVQRSSSWFQKLSQGSFGFVLKQPYAISSMVGI